MDALRRTSTLRRVAMTASLAALLLPAAQAEAAKAKKKKSPVITSVSPMEATVGDTLTIKGRHFRKGKGKNSVGFKRDGAAVVFVKASVSTKKTMIVKLPAKLETVLYGGTPAQFSLRILAARFGRSYTPDRLSPTIAPRPPAPAEGPGGTTGPGGVVGPDGQGPGGPAPPAFDPAGPNGDCDGDKILNKDESGDIDNDLLSDDLENQIGTDGCKADSDGDLAIDAYEYKSAVDLNDDEYQQPNTVLPYPGARPYPNPLDADAGNDYDGDSLTLFEEYSLWDKQGGRAPDETFGSFATKHLSYSDGLQYSVYEYCPSAANPAACGPNDANRRVPTLRAAGYDKQVNFLNWAGAAGYSTVRLQQPGPVWDRANPPGDFDIRDVNRNGALKSTCGGPLAPNEVQYFDFDCDAFVSDDERDEDADGLTNYDEAHGRMLSAYWTSCYTAEEPYKIQYAGTSLVIADSDGDGVRDGADDQDHDDVPNLMELSRMAASGLNDTQGRYCKVLDGLEPDAPNHPDAYGKVQPFDPCDPAWWSRTCDRHPAFGTAPDPDWWSLQ